MATGHGSATGPTVTLVQLPNGQTVQVHGVIQAAQPSVIQSPQVQAVQVKHTNTYGTKRTPVDRGALFCFLFCMFHCCCFSQISTVAESEDSQESVDSVTDCQKRREILSRRPSYRWLLCFVLNGLMWSTWTGFPMDHWVRYGPWAYSNTTLKLHWFYKWLVLWFHQQENPERPFIRCPRCPSHRGGESRGGFIGCGRPCNRDRHGPHTHLPNQQRTVQWVNSVWCPLLTLKCLLVFFGFMKALTGCSPSPHHSSH